MLQAEKMTQDERVLNYMKQFGGITTQEAFIDLGVTRLSAKIYNLKKRGYKITSEYKTGKNRFGETTYFKKYMLEKDKFAEMNEGHIPKI